VRWGIWLVTASACGRLGIQPSGLDSGVVSTDGAPQIDGKPQAVDALMMAGSIARIGTSSGPPAASPGSPLNVAAPTGAQIGDVLVLAIYADGGTEQVTPPTAWQLLFS
jgi:hypothetical protein